MKRKRHSTQEIVRKLREAERLTAQSNRLKSAYCYNGLGMRMSHAINASAGTTDDDVTDSSDSLTFFAYDERWRMVASYVGAGSGGAAGVSQSERYVHHAAGVGGFGGSSYIDSVLLRDRDFVNGSSSAEGAAHPFEERTYIL